jgi:hypothetical protein
VAKEREKLQKQFEEEVIKMKEKEVWLFIYEVRSFVMHSVTDFLIVFNITWLYMSEIALQVAAEIASCNMASRRTQYLHLPKGCEL